MKLFQQFFEKYNFSTRRLYSLIEYIFLMFSLGNIMFFTGFPLLSMSSYLPSIKSHHDLSQWQVNLIAEFLSVGISFMFLGSLIIDVIFSGSILGSLIAIMLGSVFLSLSYCLNGVIWIFMYDWYLYMISHYFIGLGCIMGYVGVLHIATKLIPTHLHGFSIGWLLAIFGGTGSAVFSQVSSIVIRNHKSFSYYFWICALCAGPGMISAWILLRIVLFLIHEETNPPQNVLWQRLVYIKDLLLGRRRSKMKSVAAGLLSDQEESTPVRRTSQEEEAIPSEVNNDIVSPAYLDDTDDISFTSTPFETIIAPKASRDPLWKYLISIELWLIAIVYAISSSIGLFIIYNVGSIIISLGGENGEQNLHVTILSICNCIGRIVFGSLSDLFAKWFSRSFFLSVAVSLTFLTQLYFFLIVNIPAHVYAAVICQGLAYGGTNTLMPVLVRQRFGSNHFATIMGIIMLGYQIFGGVAIATLIPAWLYEREVPNSDSHQCFGVHCYGNVYIMNMCLSLFAFIASLVLCLKVRVRGQNIL